MNSGPLDQPVQRTDTRRSLGDDVSVTSLECVSTPEPIAYRPFSPYIITLLIPASIFGVLARLGLTAVASYDGHSVFPLAYSQATGCFVMGFAVGLREPLGHFYGPLYTAITTGFCGSLTTFSSWQLDTFNSWINNGNFHRSGFYDFVDGVTKIAFTLALALGSASFGHHLACQTFDSSKYLSRSRLTYPIIPETIRDTILIVSVLMYGAVFLTFFLLPQSFRHQATASLLFAFPGALTRYYLSVTLNPMYKNLPVGTFTANIGGTAILAGLHALQNLRTSHPGPVACGILQGLIDGYCGCLTTVSTFAIEIRTLGGRKAWVYTGLSVICGQVIMLLIFGPPIWVGEVSEQITCSFES